MADTTVASRPTTSPICGVPAVSPPRTSRVNQAPNQPNTAPAPMPTAITAPWPRPALSASAPPNPNADTNPPRTAPENQSPANTSNTPSSRSPKITETASTARPIRPITTNTDMGGRIPAMEFTDVVRKRRMVRNYDP